MVCLLMTYFTAGFLFRPTDFLHNPDGRRDKTIDQSGSVLSPRGIANIGFLIFLALALTSVLCVQITTSVLFLHRIYVSISFLLRFSAGYPIFSYFQTHKPSNLGGHNIGGVNGSGQVPTMPGGFGLIDPDTPKSAYYYNTHKDNSKWQLVFSDEFNVDGRSFYPVRLRCVCEMSAYSLDPPPF